MHSKFAALLWLSLFLTTGSVAAPVEFQFTPSTAAGNPFSRELDAEIRTPSGKILRLPAFYVKANRYAIRVRADEMGVYQLGNVYEFAGGNIAPVKIRALSKTSVKNDRVRARPSLLVSDKPGSKFALSDGTAFIPIGANLAWALGNPERHYRRAFEAFRREELNWTRIWMAHWGRLNLDWLPPASGRPLVIGELSGKVAARWDEILRAAENAGVYVQVVLQHHGQYSSEVNPNWLENPWNAANPGGFLKTPGEFFTSERARALTKLKYRYIVARWGWSPAVMAWELFNEVHWVDALRLDKNEAAVAAWHAEMAAYIRSIDAYDHLVTTSTDDLHSAVYSEMDYYQPHLYAPDMIASPQRFEVDSSSLDRPVFYGEVGEDHMRASELAKASGVLLVPPVWAGLMGGGHYPPQLWLGDQLLKTKRLGELGAVGRFARQMYAGAGEPFAVFYPKVESSVKEPVRLHPGQHWKRAPSPVITVPTDGRYSPSVADMPQFIVGDEEGIAEGFPNGATIQVALPENAIARIHLADAQGEGAVLRVSVDGRLAAEEFWAALEQTPGVSAEKRPRVVTLPLTAGEREIVFENTGGASPIEIDFIDFGIERPALAAVGKRSKARAAVWLWQPEGVFATTAPQPMIDGVLVLDDIAEGNWRVTWWDSLKGEAHTSAVVSHRGGALRLKVPPFTRHTAVIVDRGIPVRAD